MSKLSDALRDRRARDIHRVECPELSFISDDGKPLSVWLQPAVLADRLKPGMGGLASDDPGALNSAVLRYLVDHGKDESGARIFEDSDYKALINEMPLSESSALAGRIARVMANADAQEEAEALGN